MPTRTGYLVASAAVSDATPSITINLQDYAGNGWPGDVVAASALAGGPRSRALPVTSLARARTGWKARNWTDDFYYRIYIETALLDVGGVVGTQERSVYVWNAYPNASKTLQALSPVDADGINILGQPAPPLAFRPLQVRTYTIQVTTDGPPTIAALLTWDFLAANDVALAIVGTRVIGWAWRPDWSSPILERLEWLTDVLKAKRGEEQRRALRLRPRKGYEFAFGAEGRDRRFLEACLWNWGARVWAVPLWHEGQPLAAALPAGSTSIPVDPSLRDLQAGGIGMLVGETARDNEVVEIQSVGVGSLTLKRATARAWAVGTMFYPARAARLAPEVALPRFTGDAVFGRARFEMTEPDTWTADAGAISYRGLPVLELRPNWAAGVDPGLERDLATIDGGVGVWTTDDRAELPTQAQRMGWTFTSRAEVDAWRKRLHAARGRQGAMWVPTWASDLVITAPVLSTATSIDVQHTGYTVFLRADPNRRDIRIELADGTIFYRRITSSLEVDADTERLNIDAALGVDVNPADVALVSFLALARFDSDSAELAHWTGELAETVATLRSFRHEL